MRTAAQAPFHETTVRRGAVAPAPRAVAHVGGLIIDLGRHMTRISPKAPPKLNSDDTGSEAGQSG
jgi:predicted sugar kinase